VLVGHVEEVIGEGGVVVLAEAREMGVADDDVNVGDWETAVIVD
jgi:hypothetical protein